MTIKEVITERDRKGYIQFDGQNVLMLASNDYLGLSTDPDVIAGATAACNRYGTGMAIYPAFITSDEHRALERELAKFLEVDAVILTASGGAANAVALTGLVGKGDIIFSDADNHASTIDAGRLSRADVIPFATRNPRDLRNRMSNVPKTGRKLIVTNGVFSMDGGLAPLVELIDICQEYDALLVVDDAHGTGVVGECGQGSLSAATVGSHEQADVFISGSLSKAIGGGGGGFLGGSRDAIERLRATARSFIFTQGMTSAQTGAALAALRRHITNPAIHQTLWRNIEVMEISAKHHNLEILPSQSAVRALMIQSSEAAVKLQGRLLKRQIFAQAMTYPIVPDGRSRLRLQVSAAHDADALEAAMSIIAEELVQC